MKTLPKGYGIQGTIWLDSATYLVKRIDYEYLDGKEPFSRVTINYADIKFGNALLRMPSDGNAWLHVRGPSRLFASSVRADIAITYWNFAETNLPPR